jgi:hypothetical protein
MPRAGACSGDLYGLVSMRNGQQNPDKPGSEAPALMKTLTLLAACLFTAEMTMGQGQVEFANTSTTPLTTNRNLTPPFASGNIAPEGHYIVRLFMGPEGSDYSSLSPVAYVMNSSRSGHFSAGIAHVPFQGYTAFQVRAWSAGFGDTWADVESKLTQYDGTGNAIAGLDFAPGTYYLGSSTIGLVWPAIGIGPPSQLFGIEQGQVSGFSLNEVVPIPEPDTLALVGLGLAGLLFIRRRA